MGEITGMDGEISNFVGPFDGRWPTQDESSPAAAAGAGRRRAGQADNVIAVVRWARWDSAGRTLELGIGPPDVASSACAIVFIYLPECLQAPPLVFAGDGLPGKVSEALDALSSRAATKRTTLSVLVDQAVGAILDHSAEGGSWAGSSPALSLQERWNNSVSRFADLSDIARQHGKSLDVLICLAAAACRSLRRVSLLDPFPHCFLDASGGRDFDACSQCLLALPPVASLEEMSAERGGCIIPSQQASVLRWLWDLKGVAIIGDTNAEELMEHTQEGDFVVQLQHGNDPVFDTAEANYGSVKAYHGSSPENFHCILRCGLKSFSGTKRMNTGDVYGEGVYLSSDLRLARSFASRGRVWHNSRLGNYITCVACCRIALHPSIRRQKETAKMSGGEGLPLDSIPHTYYVVPDPRYIRIEALLVIPDGQRQRTEVRDAQGEQAAGGDFGGLRGVLSSLVWLVVLMCTVWWIMGILARRQGV